MPKTLLALSPLALFGVLLLAGLLAGEAARRYLRLPRITGYVLAGAALGPEGTGLLARDMLFELRLVVDLAIGLIVFELGSRLDFAWLRRNRWLFASALAECTLSFWAVYFALAYFGFRPLLSATAAAIATATSPAVIIMVSRELRSEGQVTERMLLFTAVNCVFAYVALALLLPFLHFEQKAHLGAALLHPAYVFAGAAALGYGAGRLLLWLARWIGKDEERQFVLTIAAVVVTIGVAHSAQISVPVALVTLGMVAHNLDAKHSLVRVEFGAGGQLFYVILFVLTGASLEFEAFGAAALTVVALFVVARFLGKAAGLLVFGRLSGTPPGTAGLLAIALTPMSGQAVVMVRDTFTIYPSFGRELAAIVLSAVAVLELIGPLATQFALRSAAEARPDA